MYLSKSSENPSGQTARWKVTNILRCWALPTLCTVPIRRVPSLADIPVDAQQLDRLARHFLAVNVVFCHEFIPQFFRIAYSTGRRMIDEREHFHSSSRERGNDFDRPIFLEQTLANKISHASCVDS